MTSDFIQQLQSIIPHFDALEKLTPAANKGYVKSLEEKLSALIEQNPYASFLSRDPSLITELESILTDLIHYACSQLLSDETNEPWRIHPSIRALTKMDAYFTRYPFMEHYVTLRLIKGYIAFCLIPDFILRHVIQNKEMKTEDQLQMNKSLSFITEYLFEQIIALKTTPSIKKHDIELPIISQFLDNQVYQYRIDKFKKQLCKKLIKCLAKYQPEEMIDIIKRDLHDAKSIDNHNVNINKLHFYKKRHEFWIKVLEACIVLYRNEKIASYIQVGHCIYDNIFQPDGLAADVHGQLEQIGASFNHVYEDEEPLTMDFSSINKADELKQFLNTATNLIIIDCLQNQTNANSDCSDFLALQCIKKFAFEMVQSPVVDTLQAYDEISREILAKTRKNREAKDDSYDFEYQHIYHFNLSDQYAKLSVSGKTKDYIYTLMDAFFHLAMLDTTFVGVCEQLDHFEAFKKMYVGDFDYFNGRMRSIYKFINILQQSLPGDLKAEEQEKLLITLPDFWESINAMNHYWDHKNTCEYAKAVLLFPFRDVILLNDKELVRQVFAIAKEILLLSFIVTYNKKHFLFEGMLAQLQNRVFEILLAIKSMPVFSHYPFDKVCRWLNTMAEVQNALSTTPIKNKTVNNISFYPPFHQDDFFANGKVMRDDMIKELKLTLRKEQENAIYSQECLKELRVNIDRGGVVRKKNAKGKFELFAKYKGPNAKTIQLGASARGSAKLIQNLDSKEKEMAVIKSVTERDNYDDEFYVRREAGYLKIFGRSDGIVFRKRLATGEKKSCKKLYFIQTFCPGMNLQLYLDTKKPTVIERLNILLQILGLINWFYSLKLLHCDIKPANFIFNEKTKKIDFVDLGGMRKIGEPENIMASIGSPCFIDPDLLKENINHKHSIQTELYSFGAVIAYAFKELKLFRDEKGRIIEEKVEMMLSANSDDKQTLTLAEKNALTSLVNNLQGDYNKRASIESVTKELNQIYSTRANQSQISNHDGAHSAVRESHAPALKITPQ